MEYLLLIGLGFSSLCSSAEGSAESREVAFGLDAPYFEERTRDWEFLTAPSLIAGTPEQASRENVWLPCPCLQYEDEGMSGAQRRTSLLLHPDRTSQEDPDGLRLPSASTTDAFHWRETALPGRSPVWFLLNSLDALVGLENIHVSVSKGVSEVSVSTKLSTLLESLGTPLDQSIFLGIHVDLLGFDEFEATPWALLDARHGTPRVSYLSTGIGVTFKF